MKKLILSIFLLAAGLMSCSSSSDKEEWFNSKKYTFECSFVDSDVMIVANLFEYTIDGDKTTSRMVTRCNEGRSEVFYSDPLSGKVKVRLDFGYGNEKTSKWVKEVFYLTEKGKNEIVITGETQMVDQEP